MRFFPRGAFTTPPTTPVQASDPQVQLQQAQQLQQQLQQFQQIQQQAQQFQQQLWQQVGMSITGPQSAAMGPAFLFQVQVQALAMQMDLRADPVWVQVGMGGFGRPIF